MIEALFTELEQAQVPAQARLPELEIEPSECLCCWDWWFKDAELGIGAWFGPWESHLRETQPDLYELLDLKWRPNTIWKASVGAEQDA